MSKNHYVDNKKFLAALDERQKLVQKCEEDSVDPPKISDYIGKCIFDICNNLSYSPNFIGYSYRQEMIGDALENCFRVVDNFDSKISSNPFAYFTQIAYFAFLRRIEIEKKQSYIKGKLIEDLPIDDLVEHDPDTGETHNFIETIRENYYFDTAQYEEKKKNKKNRKVKLEEFMESDANE